MMASKSARRSATWAAAVLAAFSGLALPGLALALEWNLQPAGSQLAADIHGLHEYVMILCTVIFVGVFGFMFYSVYAHRKSVGHKAANFHERIGVEIAWTVIPLIILVIIVWPAIKTVMAQKDSADAGIAVEVAGYQLTAAAADDPAK